MLKLFRHHVVYEARPYIYAVIAVATLKNYPTSTVGQLSAATLVGCAGLILYWRLTYRQLAKAKK